MATFGFSANDAKRIGAAVRIVEGDRTGRRAGSGYTPGVNAGVRIMLGKIGSAAWSKATTATVTIWAGEQGSEASVATVVARNYFAAIPSGSSGRWVGLSNNGFGWVLIAAEC
jgi:hypothetical protein